MERLKRIGAKLLYPGKVLSVGIPLVGFGTLIAVFCYGMTDHPLSYLSYYLAFYALVIVVANSIPLVQKGVSLYGKVKATGVFQMSRMLVLSMAINLVYAGYTCLWTQERRSVAALFDVSSCFCIIKNSGFILKNRLIFRLA